MVFAISLQGNLFSADCKFMSISPLTTSDVFRRIKKPENIHGNARRNGMQMVGRGSYKLRNWNVSSIRLDVWAETFCKRSTRVGRG